MNKQVLFSPIGDHDPVGINKRTKEVSDGSMLHILRQHPNIKVVVLFLTKEMSDKDKLDNRYEKAIRTVNKDCKIEKIYTDIVEANDYDTFMQQFNSEITRINKTYPEYEILLNVSSGTPQIKSTLLLEVISNSVKLTPIQVSTPQRASNNNNDEYTESMLNQLDESKELGTNRCIVPDIYCFRKTQTSSQIKSLINQYEYNSAIEILKSSNINHMYHKDLIKLLTHAKYRMLLNYEKAQEEYKFEEKINDVIEYFYTIKIKQEKGELSDFLLKLPPIITKIYTDIIEEYISLDDITEKDVKGISHITRKRLEEKNIDLLDFLDEKFGMFNGFRDTFINTKTLKYIAKYISTNYFKGNPKAENQYNRKISSIKKFPDIEEKLRNTTAHNMVIVTERMIENNCGYKSTKLIRDLEIALNLIYEYDSNDFIYNKINRQIEEWL